MSESAQKYLYRYESKSIQTWILSSNKLRDLAGGSALIEALTQDAEKAAESLGATVYQATSGAMTALFPSEDALKAFASEWPMFVAFRTPGIQLVQAWVPDTGEGLGSLFQKLSARRHISTLTSLEVNPWVLRAGLSGLPAVPEKLRSSARQTAQDQVSLAKERALQREHWGKDVPVTGGHDWDDFDQELDQWPEGPVAVIHADGTGVGRALMNIAGGGDDALRNFSEALKEASAAAIKAAVGEVERSYSSKLLARPVVSAGDDLTYIVLGSDARRFAEAWLRAFESATAERADALGGGQLYGGAGIVMVHRGYPFSRAYKLAEDLCKEAKDKIKASNDAERSVLAFKRVTNSLVDNITKDAIGWVVSDTSPSPLEQLVIAIKPLPRGTLRTWLDHFQRRDGETQAARLWARMREVASPKDWQCFEDALISVGADSRTGKLQRRKGGELGPAFPLARDENEGTEGENDENERTTPISDALTLRFVEGKKRSGNLTQEETANV